MFGKAIGLSFVILGIYIIFSFLTNLSNKQEKFSSHQYHIGCYENDHVFNQSKNIQSYLQNVQQKYQPYSIQTINDLKLKIQSNKVHFNKANEIAIQFKKYINEYQNLKSRNQYQQSFNRGLRQAFQDYQKCRDTLLGEDWDCKNTFELYTRQDVQFNLTKQKIKNISQKVYLKQKDIQNLLQNDEMTDIETGSYHKNIRLYNQQINTLNDLIKNYKQNLNVNIIPQQKRLITQIQIHVNSSQQCKLYKSQIQYCQNISNKIKYIGQYKNQEQFRKQNIKRINEKNQILSIYQKNLINAKKMGSNIDQWLSRIQQITNQLSLLYDLNNSTVTFCSSQIFIKCSDQKIILIENQLKNLRQGLITIQANKLQAERIINASTNRKQQLTIKIAQLNDQYQKHLSSPKTMKSIQNQKKQQLNQYRLIINELNKQIMQQKNQIKTIQENKINIKLKMGQIILKAAQITHCLSKKQYFIKLKAKQPHSQSSDWNMHSKEPLKKVVRSSYQ